MANDISFVPAAHDSLSYCLYRSTARPGLPEAEVEAIVAHSVRRNGERGLTGCLHYENGTFFQWLEGPWRQVFQLLDVLQEDPRHWGVTVLDQGVLTQRLFENWQMRRSDPAAASLFAWLGDWRARPEAGDAEYARRVNAFLASLAERG